MATLFLILAKREGFCDDLRPHPWIADAPPALARLIDTGHVRILVEDVAVRNAQRTALTLFNINVQYNHRFTRTSSRRTGRTNGDVRIATVQAKFQNTKVTLAHEIKLTSSYQPEKPWDSRLLLHEMDHVAISTDPRLIKILESLLRAPAQLNIALSVAPDQDATLITQAIHDLQRLRRDSVQKIVQQYYDRLDQQTKNGLDDIDQRAEFFLTLYSKQDLESLEFPYLNEIRSALTSVDLDAVKNHYLASELR